MTTACSRIVSIVLTAAGESLIAMSGGVDSSVAALLTQNRGYDYVGCTMKLFDDPSTETARSRTFCALEDVEDARSVAFRTGVPYHYHKALVFQNLQGMYFHIFPWLICVLPG